MTSPVWDLKTPEGRAAYHRAYRATHKAEKAARQRAWYARQKAKRPARTAKSTPERGISVAEARERARKMFGSVAKEER